MNNSHLLPPGGGQQRDGVQAVKDNLQTRLNTLRNGDWEGDSAEVFYAEMDSVVFPALGRLVAALDDAAQTTLGIREVMAQAELDVAAIFRERDTGGAGKGKGLADITGPFVNESETPVPPPIQTPIPEPVPTPPLSKTPTLPSMALPPSSKLPTYQEIFTGLVDTQDSYIDYGRNTTSSVLGIFDTLKNEFQNATSTLVESPVLNIRFNPAQDARIIVGDRIDAFLQGIQEIVFSEKRSLNLMERLGEAAKSVLAMPKASAGVVFVNSLKDAFGLSELAENASLLAKTSKLFPWIGLGLDFLFDSFKYGLKDGKAL